PGACKLLKGLLEKFLRDIGPYPEFNLRKPGPSGILEMPQDYVGVGALEKTLESPGGFPFGRSLVLAGKRVQDAPASDRLNGGIGPKHKTISSQHGGGLIKPYLCKGFLARFQFLPVE